tara:strand:+ start:300 stop:641 length:342 start_codon:yes stop_codon:yes gene_type:complete
MIKGDMDDPAFAAYMQKILIPEISPGTTVIVVCHVTLCNKKANAALKTHGCWFLYLPSYSPELNPIELTFSKLKAHLRHIFARSFTSVFDAIGGLCKMHSKRSVQNTSLQVMD